MPLVVPMLSLLVLLHSYWQLALLVNIAGPGPMLQMLGDCSIVIHDRGTGV